jgi:lipopolysaccharide export system permease protein
VYGRLAHDNEVVAIKAAGVHLYTLLAPAVLLGTITTAVTGGLYLSVIPLTQQRLQEELLKDPEEALYNVLRRERCLRHPSSDFVLYVRDVQGRRLVDVVLKQRAKTRDPATGNEVMTGYDFVARAREARLRVDVAEGRLYIDPDRFVFYNPTTRGTTSSNGPVPVKLPDNFNANDAKNRPSALVWDDLLPRVEELRQERDEKEEERADVRRRAESLPDGDFKRLALAQDALYKGQVETATRQMRNVEAELYLRPALAAGCLVFALIGCPVGIWATRADYLSTFVICFLPAVCVYYPLLFAGSNLGKDGKLPLGLGCWLADLAVGVAGLVLTWRLLRR